MLVFLLQLVLTQLHLTMQKASGRVERGLGTNQLLAKGTYKDKNCRDC
jgi:hypothetical protein